MVAWLGGSLSTGSIESLKDQCKKEMMTTVDEEILFWALTQQHYEHVAASYKVKGNMHVSKFYASKAANAKQELEKLQNGGA